MGQVTKKIKNKMQKVYWKLLKACTKHNTKKQRKYEQKLIELELSNK